MTDTKNTAGATNTSNKIFLVGATSQAANPQTYSHDTAYVGTDGHLYSDSKQVVNLSGTQALTNKTYNGYTLAAASAKGVDTSIAAGSTSTNLPTTAAVENRIQIALAEAEVGSAAFQGVVDANTAITGLSDYKRGWYWAVGTAGTFVGQACEAGDFIFCISNKATTFSNADFKVVQANIDMSQFGALAYKNSASGTLSLDIPTVNGTVVDYDTEGNSVLTDVAYSGSASFSGTQKYLHINTTKNTATSTGNFTPSGSIAITKGTGTANYTPEGSVSTPTITVTPNTTTVNSITNVGTLPSAIMPVFDATVSNETLSLGWTAGSFSAGTLPTKGSDTTVVTGIKSATSTQPTFTGTGAELTGTFTGTEGTVSVTTSDAVTAVSGSVNTTAASGIDIKPAGTILLPTLNKTTADVDIALVKGSTVYGNIPITVS